MGCRNPCISPWHRANGPPAPCCSSLLWVALPLVALPCPALASAALLFYRRFVPPPLFALTLSAPLSYPLNQAARSTATTTGQTARPNWECTVQCTCYPDPLARELALTPVVPSSHLLLLLDTGHWTDRQNSALTARRVAALVSRPSQHCLCSSPEQAWLLCTVALLLTT